MAISARSPTARGSVVASLEADQVVDPKIYVQSRDAEEEVGAERVGKLATPCRLSGLTSFVFVLQFPVAVVTRKEGQCDSHYSVWDDPRTISFL